MELIDRYLAAVGVLLPNRQREDITAELRDALTTQRDEQQAELGRPSRATRKPPCCAPSAIRWPSLPATAASSI
jgi:hypothetical protein